MKQDYGPCQIDGCNQRARFGIFKTEDGTKKWLYVCRWCEKEIGRENMERAGGYYGR